MHSMLYPIKFALVVLTLIVIGGCTKTAMNLVIASWKDQPISEAIAAWGKPSEELNVGGQHLFLWNTYDGILVPPDIQKPLQPADTRYCMRLLKVDMAGKIIYGNWDGENCPGLFSGWSR